jgi:hypothetical protein
VEVTELKGRRGWKIAVSGTWGPWEWWQA